MNFITDYIESKAVTYLTGGVTAVGGLAGNAVGGLGSLIETSGRAVGNSVEGFIRKGGNFINSYGEGLMDSTATQNGRVKKTTTQYPSAASHSTANISATPSAAKKLVSSTPTASTRALASTATSAQRIASNASSAGIKTIAPASKPLPKARTPGVSSSKVTSTTAASGKVRISEASRPGGVKKTVSAPPVKSSPAAGGKVKISAESRPKPKIAV